MLGECAASVGRGGCPRYRAVMGGAGIGADISSLVLRLLPGREVPNNGEKREKEREKFLYPSTLPPKTNPSPHTLQTEAVVLTGTPR